VKKAVQLLSSVPQELTRMKFNRTLVNFALLVISVTVATILAISQAITVQMGFIVPMEQDMPLSLAVQMEHMVMVPTFSILISVSSAHLENSVMVHPPLSPETVRKDTIADLVLSLLHLLMDSLERNARKDIIVSAALLHRKVVHLEHLRTYQD